MNLHVCSIVVQTIPEFWIAMRRKFTLTWRVYNRGTLRVQGGSKGMRENIILREVFRKGGLISEPFGIVTGGLNLLGELEMNK